MLKNLLEVSQVGEVTWLGVRPEREQPMLIVDALEARCDKGIVGDRYSGRSGERQVTLIQAEHLATIAALLGWDEVTPEQLRRNIAVAGINLLALKGKQFSIGGATLAYTGLCHPCSRMEKTFGSGGYNAVRGHGGITARVITPGIIRIGDSVQTVYS
ncbi:MOSC domain-containing protein [Saccharophagus degradans]|uniref:MOSC domain-containing protein n=1 Tax=Saccharophagus degradans TaxID=86304 RepID=A0AAW7X5S7_9GAMM|nr:MOSC domain-containing protein [Saccharophagus degradans]MDO6422101.1 MOSC domain-containing protein [Saccharophagus degradans]MDO6609344.1 MOSC domain-containing protein [Saccharophagus degradans]